MSCYLSRNYKVDIRVIMLLLESDYDLTLLKEVKELEKVIAEIGQEWGASKKEMVDSIEDFKNQVNEKKEKLD